MTEKTIQASAVQALGMRLYAMAADAGKYSIEGSSYVKAGDEIFALLATATEPPDPVPFAIAALKNSGIDMECGACAEVAFCGSAMHEHTCKPSGTYIGGVTVSRAVTVPNNEKALDNIVQRVAEFHEEVRR